MFTFALIIILAIIFGLLFLAINVGGILSVIYYADIIVCVFILVCIFKHIFKKDKQKKE